MAYLTLSRILVLLAFVVALLATFGVALPVVAMIPLALALYFAHDLVP